jgi:hypothetical protein
MGGANISDCANGDLCAAQAAQIRQYLKLEN